MDDFDRTIVGAPPDAPSPADGGASASPPPPAPAEKADDARKADAKARKRESDREAQRRSRERKKGSKPAAQTPPVTVAPPPPVVVTPPPLEQLLPSVAMLFSSLTDDGRGVLAANLKNPVSGKTLAADLGSQLDAAFSFYGVTLTPEVTVWVNVALSLTVAVGTLSRVPAMTTAEAMERLPAMQAAMGGSH